MIKNYLSYLLYSRWLSINTVNRYRKALRYFEDYLLKEKKTLEKPEDLYLADVYWYVAEMGKNWAAPSTCNNFINAVRWYLRYLRGVLDMKVIDPEKIISCKSPDRNIGYFNKQEKKQILKAVKVWIWKRSITQLRNKLITYMLLHTWLRCHEIAKIKVSEIWENLQVLGKWWKLRSVFIRPELMEMIDEYLSARKRESDYLFDSTKKGKHLYEWSIRKIYMEITKKVWFHVHAHKFRHTFATDLLHIPWSNIYNVAKLMGHKRITTTQIYLWCDNTELKKLQFWLNF